MPRTLRGKSHLCTSFLHSCHLTSMRQFKFKLAALLKYRVYRRDMCRRLLAEVMADERAVVERITKFQASRTQALDELRAMGRGGRINVDRTIARRYYAGQLFAEIQMAERQREVIRQQLDLCRQALILADRDVKALEKLEARQRDEFLREEEHRAGRELDDVWLSAHAREFSR